MLGKIGSLIKNFSFTKGKIKAEPINFAAKTSIAAKNKFRVLFWMVVVLLFLAVQLAGFYQGANKATNEVKDAPFKIEVASQALDADKMWRNYFEERLKTTTDTNSKAISEVSESINDLSSATEQSLRVEINKLNEQMKLLQEQQWFTKAEVSSVKAKINQEPAVDAKETIPTAQVVVNKAELAQNIEPPKSQYNFIPETAYLHGVLLGGISVSTALGSSAEPVPVVIRITDRGNLPKNFALDLTKCQILGGSYGDLSSERAIIRAEVLSCNDDAAELIHTTKIAGIVYGDDGMNGIKGHVVQTSSKHLRNAILGGMISGFANTARGQEGVVFNSLGAATREKNTGDLLKESGFAGTANAADKIAEYYIKQAEAMSPVLSVSGGVKVDVVFTKGVMLNTQDVGKKLEQQRQYKG